MSPRRQTGLSEMVATTAIGFVKGKFGEAGVKAQLAEQHFRCSLFGDDSLAPSRHPRAHNCLRGSESRDRHAGATTARRFSFSGARTGTCRRMYRAVRSRTRASGRDRA
jgi:hypothetical protein